ncbi:uncharacterized protein LOC132783615 isoform X1 [Drosophila nasuta]|uniref:uncharacterized protein LOC132783615 isoform X1 n=1 Tax=Drosophila nasuta TaxID=42062 RepID=UPI00295E8943|nr:uncharacterized protein LOC132783615 isoform X1 [Drosophila nasuta]
MSLNSVMNFRTLNGSKLEREREREQEEGGWKRNLFNCKCYAIKAKIYKAVNCERKVSFTNSFLEDENYYNFIGVCLSGHLSFLLTNNRMSKFVNINNNNNCGYRYGNDYNGR